MANFVTRALTAVGLRKSAPSLPAAPPALAAGPQIETRSKGRSGLGTRVVQDLSLWLQYQRIGGNTTPQQVSSILRDADNGSMRRLQDLANDARQKDCHLQAVLSQAEEEIAGLEWSLTLPDNAKARDRKAAAWVEHHLRFKVAAAFYRMLAHQAGSIYHGYAVSETLWAKDTDGRVAPIDWENLAPRRFGFRPADGQFVWRDDSMPTDGVDFLEENPNKFVVSRPRVTGDVPQREGLNRLLVWTALFRNWDLTDWLRTGEASWKPWRIGTYGKNADTEDIADLENVLQNLTTNGWAAIPETDKIQIEWPAGTGGTQPTHATLHNVLGNEMSKAVLGQTETTQASSSSGYAQSKTHEKTGQKKLKARAQQIAAFITKYVIRPMIQLNFGADIEVPAFTLKVDDTEQILPFAQGISALVQKAGLRLPAKWVRQRIGAPEPDRDDEEEELLGVVDVDIPIDPTTGLPTDPAAEGGTSDNPKPSADSAAENADDVEDAPSADDPKA